MPTLWLFVYSLKGNKNSFSDLEQLTLDVVMDDTTAVNGRYSLNNLHPGDGPK